MGHVHGWTVGAPAREKESQKAQQRVASMMEGIYDDFLSGFFPSLRNLLKYTSKYSR
jgi:hypothetical protein